MATRTTAFGYAQWSQIQEAIKSLNKRALTHVRHNVKVKTLFDAFVCEADKDALLRTNKICDIHYGHQYLEFERPIKDVEVEGVTLDIAGRFTLVIQEHAKFKFLFPKYMSKGKIENSSPELDDALRTIATVNFEWARVLQVLMALQESCSSPSQVKTLCPAIAPMLKEMGGSTAEFGERLYNMRDTEKLPALPLMLRQAAVQIGTTITKALIIPEKSEEVPDEFLITQRDESKTHAKRWDGYNWAVTVR